MEPSQARPVGTDPSPADTTRSDDVLQRLRAAGCRVTAPRRAVVEALLTPEAPGHHHVTAEQLAERVRDRNPDIHRATIYRTLDALLDAGVITHVHLGHGPATFHLQGRTHHHAVCNNCGRSVELPHHTLDAVHRHLADSHGWQLTVQHFALSALCDACQHSDA